MRKSQIWEIENMRNNLSELRREAEEYFRQVSQDLNAANEAYRHILRMLDASLATGDYTELLFTLWGKL